MEKIEQNATSPALEISSKVLINVVVTFEVMATRPVNAERLRAWYEDRFAAAGITMPHEVEVLVPKD